MNESFLIKPLKSIGRDVSTSMFTKKFFEQHLPSVRSKEHLHSLVERQVNFPIIWLDQIHGVKVKKIYEAKSRVIQYTDGLYTQNSNLILAIKTADCLPLILSNKEGSEISALHVGWRGLYKGIIEKALSFFQCDLKEVTAWLAPCISVENYTVGTDVFYSFANADKESISSFQETGEEEKWFFNLKLESARKLEQRGIKITTNNFCTFKDKEFFYSYRRNGTLGRMVTLVWRNDEK